VRELPKETDLKQTSWVIATLCLLLAGCTVPPGNVRRDRLDYGETLA
jgi:starvation-inducible outer membrane lipoprotein